MYKSPYLEVKSEQCIELEHYYSLKVNYRVLLSSELLIVCQVYQCWSALIVPEQDNAFSILSHVFHSTS
jgi:hypothetical protein